MNHEKLILKYFNKTLSEEEESAFSVFLENDKDFEVLFKEHSNMHKAFKINEKEELKSHLQSIESHKKLNLKTLINQKIIVFATACCLIIGVFYFINKSESNIYESYFDTYPNVLEPVVRGNATEKSEAFTAYENKNFAQSEISFKTLLASNQDANIQFYYAMSLLNQDKINEAKKILDELKSKQHDFMPEVYWYCTLIAIKHEDFEAAKSQIKTLNTLNSNFKKAEKKELLNLLE